MADGMTISEIGETLGLSREAVRRWRETGVKGRIVNISSIAATLGAKKATMADPTVAERTTGYVVGGISPVGQKKALPTVLDESATTYPTVLVSGGKRGLDLELTPQDLLTVTRGRTAAISRRG